MKEELSILIPIYNAVCVPLIEQLSEQAVAIKGLHYEILVADDGSTDGVALEANQAINHLPNCRLLMRGFNSGRAAIRNYLAQQARYAWLLFIDGDRTIISKRFLCQYLESEGQQVVYGGYSVGEGDEHNLRYCYEKHSEQRHTVEQRRKQPYRDFHTPNFMISRELMLAHPFNEQFRNYGYEDVLYGKVLRQQHIRIQHIDNPVGFKNFETNEQFLRKTEEGMRTLYQFRHELRGYSDLLTFVNGIHLNIVRSAIRLWHRLFGALERRNLEGKHPNLTIFKLYKLGYYLTLTQNN